jgi:transposase
VSPTDAERIARLESQVERLLAEVAAKDAEIARLRARVDELERKLGENSSNSNKPPSSDSPQDRATRDRPAPTGRRPGGQPGHKGKRREMLPPERVNRTRDCFPSRCRRCGDRLPRLADGAPLRHQVIDLPEIQPDVTEYRQHRVTCDCGATTCGELPTGVPAGMLGPGVLALIAVLVGECHVSRRKVRALLQHLLGIEISLGALSESEEVVSTSVDAAVDEARLHALGEQVKHVDATVWSQAGRYRALWTLATTAVTVFCIATDATRATLRTWLSQIRGVLITDRGSQFDFWAMESRQICWAHLIRKFASFAGYRGRAGEVGSLLLVWSRVLLHNWHKVRDGTISRAEFRRLAAQLRALIDALLDEGSDLPVRGMGGACRNIVAHRDAMWRFVEEDGVEPTNNHAERELRGFVLWRKATLGSRSDRGDRFAANIKSVVHTCRKQGRPVLPYLRQAVHAALRGDATPSLLVAAP